MNTQSPLQESFSRWYADLRTPVPKVEVFVSDDEMDFALTSAQEDELIESMAQASDLEGLRRFMALPKAQHTRHEATKGWRPSITFCVAHMLVDSSGNEGFARAWMSDFGAGSASTLSDEASRMASARFHHYTLGSDRSKVRNQQLLGLSTLIDVFKRPPSKSTLQMGEATCLNLCGKDDSARRADENSRVLAAILKLHHDQSLPDVDVREDGVQKRRSLVEALITGGERCHSVLPAVEMAYGGNAIVAQQVRDGLERLVRASGIDALPGTSSDGLWKCIAAWGDRSTAESVMESKGFQKELAQITGISIDRLTTLRGMGFELDTMIPSQVRKAQGAQTILHRAIVHNNADLVAWLLANDCDPLIKTISSDQSEAGRDGVYLAANSGLSGEQNDRIRSMVNAVAASRAAYAALDELGLASPGARP